MIALAEWECSASGFDPDQCTGCRFAGLQAHGSVVCFLTAGLCKGTPPLELQGEQSIRVAEVVELWRHLSSQWVVLPEIGYVGLRYEAIEPVARLARIPATREHFLLLREMERVRLRHKPAKDADEDEGQVGDEE